MMSDKTSITSVSGRLIPVHGNDIDTDRIIPARFLKCVVFNELGPHAFEDDRIQNKEKGITHPFDDSRFQGASILVVNKNFGCGSSREHAPQSLMRWGIKAVIGESFAEIFFGNCVSLGIPCLTLDDKNIAQLMETATKDNLQNWEIEIEATQLKGSTTYDLSLSEGNKTQFLTGKYNPMTTLLANHEAVKQVEANLPYGF